MTHIKSMLAIMLLLSISAITQAADDNPMQGKKMHAMHKNMTQEQKEKKMRDMQEHMLQMHDLSNQILSEKDATKKEELKQKQLSLMKAHKAKMMQMHQKMMQMGK